MTYLGCVWDVCLTREFTSVHICTKITSRLNFYVKKKQVPVERLKEILCSTLIQPHVDHACSAWYPDRPILQLASFEDTFTQGMRLEIRMQHSTAKKSFA